MLVALGMAQSGTDTCQKLSCTKWLGEIVICAQIQSSDLALSRVLAEITIIGVMLQERTCSMSFKPSISGRPKSNRITSGCSEVMYCKPSFPVLALITR